MTIALDYRGPLTGEGGVSTLVDPATGRKLTTLPSASQAETDRAIEAAHTAFPAWKAVSPGDRARLLRQFAAVVEEHLDELAALEVAELRAHHRQRPLGGRQRPGRAELLLGRTRTTLRPADPGGRRHRHHLPRTARGGRHHRAVELPDAHCGLGFRPGARRRQHGGTQTRRGHPADRPAARPNWPGGRAARGRLHGIPGKGRSSAIASSPIQWSARSCFTGSTEVGKDIMARLRRPGKAGDAGTWRQEREHHLRRRRPRNGSGRSAGRRFRQRRPGLLRPIANPGATRRVRPLPRAARAGREGFRGGDPRG